MYPGKTKRRAGWRANARREFLTAQSEKTDAEKVARAARPVNPEATRDAHPPR
jgi:hypothetical protein